MVAFYSRKALLFLTDIILVNVALFIALIIRFDSYIPAQYMNVYFKTALILTVMKIAIYWVFGLYKSLWKYASIDELVSIILATISGSAASFILGIAMKMTLPRSVYAIAWLVTTFLIGSSRLSYRIARRAKKLTDSTEAGDQKRILIIGAGDAGSMVIKEMKNQLQSKYIPVYVIDDAKWKRHSRIHGVPVIGGTEKIKEIAEKEKIDEIIIAMPSVDKKKKTEILNICKQTKCKLKTLPGVYEIIDNKVTINKIRDISIEDLLGRDEIKLNTGEISGYLENETILVTGGGGSIGSELCRQIAAFNPKKLIILDIYENNAYDLQNELLHTFKNKLDLEVVIASVRDKLRLNDIFESYRPGVVFHAAAHKHVPLMEANPAEAIKNNVFGTLNVAQCADKFGAKRFVLISTDKAVNPTNIMGATKRVAEMIIQSIDKTSRTEFVAVRFGNVLGSNGSVIPLFKKQIAQGGPVTVTHPDITRYFMTIPEAVRLVIQAGAMAKGGEIFVLDMGEPVKIADLARDLIRLSGYEPDVDIRIEYSGLRPGEKLYEELLLEEEGLESTVHDKIFVGKPLELSYNEVMLCAKALENSMNDLSELRECMARVVPTYQYTRGKGKASVN